MSPPVSEKPLEELRRIRLQKLTKLKAQGQEPFAQPQIKRQASAFVKEQPLGFRARVVGRLRSLRGHGGSIFADIIDYSGKLQIFFSRQDLGEKYELIELLDLGDFLLVEGELFKTQAGEPTLRTSNFQLLTKSLRPLPSSFYGFKDVEERYRQRYVDLLTNEEVKSRFKTRTKVVQLLREILDQEGFVEVETPVLQPLYGGATAKPFRTHHQSLGVDLYLRISDELYLKRLIVGGFEKVYELGKNFRNEGLDRQHNPEFTMLEFYWAYQTYEGLMEFTEKIVTKVVGQVQDSLKLKYGDREIDLATPWPRLTYRQAFLEACGLDLDEVADEESLRKFIHGKSLAVELKDVVGYGPLLDTIYKKLIRSKLIGPLFLIDRPAAMIPLAKRKADDPSKAASFQLVVNGFELINAYNELNDPIEQRLRWEGEAKLAERGLAESQVVDEDYLRALEYGMPPTAGWGLGIDRFVALLTNSHTIKETILFPTLRPESPDSQGTKGLVPEPREGSNPIKTPVDLPVEPEGPYPSRERALEFVKEKIKNQNLFRHMLAVEAAMKALAGKFGGNQELWGILGLLHDADWEETKSDYARHTRVTLEWLESQGYKEGPIVQALKSHNRKHTQLDEIGSIMEWALECVDELTGFIVSVALVRPEKKLSAVEVEHILKKWREKSFAAAVDRAQIEQCEEKLGIKLEVFISLVLTAMKVISSGIGL